MTIIYEPRGKAREYSPLAANLYSGCGHACIYCYAPSVTFTNPDKFSSESYIKPRKNILSLLEADAKKMKGNKNPILLSFTSDLYQPANDKFNIARPALEILSENELSITILTKGGTRACKDFDILAKNPNNTFSITLTTNVAEESIKWEPFAALPDDRIESLKIAHGAGIKTWVSFEPVINPLAVFQMIDRTHSFVDLYKVGKLNYHPYQKTINWHNFLLEVEIKLKKYNKPYYIKKDLEIYR